MSSVLFEEVFIKIANDNELVKLLESLATNQNQNVVESAKLAKDYINWKLGKSETRPIGVGMKDINTLFTAISDVEKVKRIAELCGVAITEDVIGYFSQVKVEKQYVEYLKMVESKTQDSGTKESVGIVKNFLMWKTGMLKDRPRYPRVLDIQNLFHVISDVNTIKYIAKMSEVELTEDMINYFNSLKSANKK